MAGLIPVSGVTSPCEPEVANVTVLRARDVVGDGSIPRPLDMTKRFFLGSDGMLNKTSYPDATFFQAVSVHVDGIRPMGELLRQIAKAEPRNMAIIRGISSEGYLENTRRLDANFPEHSDGTDWVMLDIDNVPVPDGITPYSEDAISWLITNKLPDVFRGVTCYYQFSSSAGVCKSNGELLKSGLCVHLFYFLSRRVQGKKLAAYLRQQCLHSEFYSIGNNKGGVATLTHGIDPAPIRSAVQLHYVANPIIGKGVTCLLNEQDRDGFIAHSRDTVQLQELADDIIETTDREQHRVLTAWKVANGYKKAMSQVHTATGIASATYYKPTQVGAIGTGRVLTGVKMSTWKHPNDVCTLVLDDENSPGSWYVLKVTPHIARRYDGTTIPLREFSESAYDYVRDELQWFIDIPHRTCHLMDDGHLPEIDSFAIARHSLILAPTGSGKTYRMVEWMAAKSATSWVIYVAQTIPLVDQMAVDLTRHETPFHHYRSFNYNDVATGHCRRSIFLTTNESLPRILEVLGIAQYVLVVDELHRAMDDFARNDQRLRMFKDAISQAQRVVYMTGTLTTIQRSMLSETVAGILGRSLTVAEYCSYEFPSVKQNPLYVRDIGNFQSDVIDLVRRYGALAEKGEPIPRTVLIMNTSKMKVFNMMFSRHGLTDHVEVVSRQESHSEEIETARTTTRPILVASPLFSIGLNFQCEPEVLWCRFDRLEADTSQINQTINRANRGDVACQVTIYTGKVDDSLFSFPPKKAVVDSLAEMIGDESVLGNPNYDMPMMLDRMAYNQYRNIEKNTSKALGQLSRDNAFQNYVVAEMENAPEFDRDNHEEYGMYRAAAKDEYDSMVIEWCERIGPNRTIMQLLDDAENLAKERKENFRSAEPRTEREIEHQEHGIIMAICRLEDPSQARKIHH